MKTVIIHILFFLIISNNIFAQNEIPKFNLAIYIPDSVSFSGIEQDSIKQFEISKAQKFSKYCERYNLPNRQFKFQYTIAINFTEIALYILNQKSRFSTFETKYYYSNKELDEIINKNIDSDFAIIFKNINLIKNKNKYSLECDIILISKNENKKNVAKHFVADDKNSGDMFTCFSSIECALTNTSKETLFYFFKFLEDK